MHFHIMHAYISIISHLYVWTRWCYSKIKCPKDRTVISPKLKSVGELSTNSTAILSDVCFLIWIEWRISCSDIFSEGILQFLTWERRLDYCISVQMYIHVCGMLVVRALTHLDRAKMAAVSKTTLSNAFSWMKMLEFWLRIHWNLLLRFELTIFQHWLR